MKENRIVITGMGAISPCGNDIPTIWNNVLAGKSGIREITRFNADAPHFKCKVAGEVKDFDPLLHSMNKQDVRKMDRVVKYGIAAVDMALKDADLKLSEQYNDHIGTLIGSGMGGMETNQAQYKNLLDEGETVSPHTIPMMMINALAGQVSLRYKLTGVSEIIASACASGNSAIIASIFRIASRDCPEEVIITGGVEAVNTDFGNVGFTNMKAMNVKYNDSPTKASMPFNKNRAGFVMGEGAGILVLESLDHARRRNAKIYAEVLGFSATSDAYHICKPDPNGRGIQRALKLAMESSGIGCGDVNYINAHGTSTLYNDEIEAEAIRSVFGSYTDDVHVSSTKGTTGHLLGAAGGIESIICTLAIQNNIVPPTINLEGEIATECDIIKHVTKATETEVNTAINCNYGFGGHNTCVVFGKHE